jgi:hypothetical protein
MNLRFILIGAALGACVPAAAAERLAVAVRNELAIARPSETITVPWAEVNRALPGALLQHIVVKDAAGHALPYQVTNVAPEAKDPQGRGVAYGELIFQHDFAAGEKLAKFTVEKSDALSPPFVSKVFARYVPERLDDFAWENDKIGHRTYGQALAAPAPAGSGKEVLVTSGMDIWFKRVSYPIIDRWYNKGHDHYHKDEGEGLDMYSVGGTRGAGGTGIWDGRTLHVSRNYSSWKVIANGPVRAIFELGFDAWDAGGRQVSEVKRFTVDAGHYLYQVDSTFTFSGAAGLTAAVGLNKTPAYKEREPSVALERLAKDGALIQWVTQKDDAFGTAVILPEQSDPMFAEDGANDLVLAPVVSGKPLHYAVGGAWTRGGEIRNREQWRAYVAMAAARLRSPLKVSLSGAP